jgi:hypothetical protein
MTDERAILEDCLRIVAALGEGGHLCISHEPEDGTFTVDAHRALPGDSVDRYAMAVAESYPKALAVVHIELRNRLDAAIARLQEVR